MDRRTRKDLKSDKFALEVQHGFEFITDHKEKAILYGSIVVAVLLIAAGIFYYNRHQAVARESALAQAMRIDNASVGSAPMQTGGLHYNTAAEKDKARDEAFSAIAAKYHGSQEAAIAEFYLASEAVDNGNLPEAAKRYQDVIDSGPTQYAAIAKISLSRVDESLGKDAEAEKLLRDLMAHPAVTVSSEEAQLDLAKLIARKNPAEGRKMLEAMQTDRTAISRAAVQALGQLSAK